MSAVRTVAPAKVNLTLEVLGRRGDGYHEVRTVLQTISLSDRLTFREADELRVSFRGAELPPDDLVERAARLLRERTGVKRGAEIEVEKAIPVGGGMGGGSTDAAATLRGLSRLWSVSLSREEMAAMAGVLGSDETFFLQGGTALAEGRGEKVTPLLDAPEMWFVVASPGYSLPDKTARMYGALEEGDFTDGRRTEALVGKLAAGSPVAAADLYNAFDRAAYRVFPELERLREALLRAGAAPVHVAGAGPTLFAPASGEREALDITTALGDVDGRVLAARSVGAEEATAVER